MKATLAIVATAALLAGCANQVINRTAQKSYYVGQRLHAPVGGPLLRIEQGTMSTVRRWVGVLNSPDGWVTETVRDKGNLSAELIYGGISGRTIEVSYREYRSEMAAPAFFQNLKYDLASSAYIVFRNFRLEVLSADNAGIEAVLVSDGAR